MKSNDQIVLPSFSLCHLAFEGYLPSRIVASVEKGVIHPSDSLLLIRLDTNEVIGCAEVRHEVSGDGSSWIIIAVNGLISIRQDTTFAVKKSLNHDSVSPTCQILRRSKILDVLQVRLHLITLDGIRYTSPNTTLLSLVSSTGSESNATSEMNAECQISDGWTFNLYGIEFSLQCIVLNNGHIDLQTRVHNARAAIHQNGLWDLGDANSIMFRCVELEFYWEPSVSVNLTCTNNSFTPVEEPNAVELFQYDSGSDVSIVSRGSCSQSVAKIGFALTNESQEITRGSRAEPIITLTHLDDQIRLIPFNFWEESPNGIAMEKNRVSLTYLGFSTESSLEELQPGESKRRQLVIQINSGIAANSSFDQHEKLVFIRRLTPVFLRLSNSGSLVDSLFMRSLCLTSTFDKELASLISTPQDFFLKREVGDEYGWRNFGEVFADHESLYIPENQPLFVSHYNNQYDMVLGFGMQYARTGDMLWFKLMNELARHITDIDIYKTKQDRSDYNYGLFWHTNHYVDAGDSTHRTYSRLNYDSKKPYGTSGGPGSEHCYTTGLMLHYRITGDQQSKHAVMGLALWIRTIYFGENCLLGQLHSVLKRDSKAFLNRLTLKTTSASAKYSYPMNRGTGNFIVAMLDAYLIDRNYQRIVDIEYVMRNTFSEDDDIDSRNLLSAEENWSYTVFLQAVVRYLHLKHTIDKIDKEYFRFQRAFVKVTRWMCVNEVPYLMSESALEFPNATWIAQEVRKVTILRAAPLHDENYKMYYDAAAQFFESYMLSELEKADSVSLSRIQAILLQNLSCVSFMQSTNASPQISNIEDGFSSSNWVLFASILRKLRIGLTAFNVRNEIAWIRTRL